MHKNIFLIYNKNYSFSSPEYVALTNHEILALLEVLWHDQPNVEFNELVSKEAYNKEDAATIFYSLLGKYILFVLCFFILNIYVCYINSKIIDYFYPFDMWCDKFY